jgi:Uma2 family endonuclease
MAPVVTSVFPAEWTFADVLAQLGGIPLERIRAVPPAGMATEQDLVVAEARTGRICELIDGVLVEKAIGYFESALAAVLIGWLGNYMAEHRLGMVLGEAGLIRLSPGQVRVPDVSVILWERFGGRGPPQVAILPLAPDLAVEVLSAGNSPGEMQWKLVDYFKAGVRLVWYVDPRARTLCAYTAPDRFALIDEQGIVEGGQVLPGLRFALADLFAEAAGPPSS